jgi:hypothetical protein
MKKTIAILLILVIGMVGVFAATYNPSNSGEKELKLTTEVVSVQAFKITDDAVSTQDNAHRRFASYTSLDVLDEVALTLSDSETITDGYIPATLSATPYLTVANNSGTGLSIYVKADPLAVTGDGTNIDTEINYNVKIGSVTIPSNSTFHTSPVMTVTADEDGLLIESKAISVDILADDYDSAKASDAYVGVVYFNISST